MPPRHHHASHAAAAGAQSLNLNSSGNGGNPFPPLGLAAAAAAVAASPGAGGSAASTAAAAAAADGLPAAPTKVDTGALAQACRLQDAYWSDDEEDLDCPLCLEEIDLSDANFRPCPCGYQICRFCWHHIKQNLNGRCPACRRKYSDQAVEFTPMTAEEIKRLTQSKKQKERERRELEQMNRKHLANMRVVQKNLVYVVGLNPKLAREEVIPTLRSNEYFGQYGRISKVLISKRTTASKLVMGTQESAIGVYVTYHRKEDAARAIVAIDGSKDADGRTIRASYGTTKYCTTYLRNLPCTAPTCTYLHEPGEETDSFTKEDLSTLRHAAKDTEFGKKTALPALSTSSAAAAAAAARRQDATLGGEPEGSALPKTASWASAKAPGTPSTPVTAPISGVIRDAEMPSLAAAAAAAAQRDLGRKASGTQKSVLAKQQAAAAAAAVRAASPAPASPLKTSAVPAAPANKRTASASPTADEGQAGERPLDAKVASAPVSSGPATPRAPAVSGDATPQPPAMPPAPPGLSRVASSVGPPPGLTPSRSGTPSGARPTANGAASGSSAGTVTSYQPSSSAQAILDDLRARRDAESKAAPRTMPFPEFDDALLSFNNGGDFCFNLRENASTSKDVAGPPGIGQAFGAFSPMGGPPGLVGAFGALGGGVPPGLGTPNRSLNGSPAPAFFGASASVAASTGTYSGSFDPFAPGAGDSIVSKHDEGEGASPFAAIDQMRRTLSEERKDGAADAAADDEDSESKRASRFGFAKRKEESASAAANGGSPFFRARADLLPTVLQQAHAQNQLGRTSELYGAASGDSDDHLGLSMRDKGVSGILGGVFGDSHDLREAHSPIPQTQHQAQPYQQSAQQQQNLHQQQAPQQHLQQQQQAHMQNTFNSNGNYGRHDEYAQARSSPFGGAGSATTQQQHRGPPPGFAHSSNAAYSHGLAGQQQQQHYSQHPQQQQQSQQHQLNGSASWLSELQRGVGVGSNGHVGAPGLQQQQYGQLSPAIEQQRHSGFFGGNASGAASGTGNTGSNSADPLLAQIMAAASTRPNVARQQQQQPQQGYAQAMQQRDAFHGGDMPFFDPAIMSMSRSQQVAAQAQAQAQQSHQYSGGFSPFGEPNAASSGGAFGHSSAYGQQQQQGQQGQQAYNGFLPQQGQHPQQQHRSYT